MKTVYFIGAGTSAADGLPTTAQLNFGVAAGLLVGKQNIELLALYADVFGIERGALRRASALWRAYLQNRATKLNQRDCPLPDLVETLSLLDVCISEGQSLGLSSLPDKRFRYASGTRLARTREFTPAFLQDVRYQLTRLVGLAVQAAAHRHPTPRVASLVRTISRDDALITTNWDLLLERALVEIHLQKRREQKLVQSPARYFCVGERPVNRKGDDLAGYTRFPLPLLRLHGGLNWFSCARCGTVYVNLEGGWFLDAANPRPDYDECHCGAGLVNVMIAPSYLKNYQNLSLRSVWREAQRQLEMADQWVFIGYSLPSDDFHIRAMLLRAIGPNAHRRKSPRITVVLNEDSGSAPARYADLLRVARPKIQLSGLAGFLDP